MDRKELAVNLHERKFNCCQSVACAFCHVMGQDAETTFRQAEAFGLGMGCMEACGAVSGMAMVVGMKMSDGNLDDPQTKKECYAMMEKLIAEFKGKHGSITCRDLKFVETADGSNPCNGYIQDAVTLLDKHLLDL